VWSFSRHETRAGVAAVVDCVFTEWSACSGEWSLNGQQAVLACPDTQ
jgi:hypothetical protein